VDEAAEPVAAADLAGRRSFSPLAGFGYAVFESTMRVGFVNSVVADFPGKS
jgi:hypothetical protein